MVVAGLGHLHLSTSLEALCAAVEVSVCARLLCRTRKLKGALLLRCKEVLVWGPTPETH